MSLTTIVEQLVAQGSPSLVYIKDTGCKIVEQIRGDQLKIIDLVQGLDPVLTNGNHEIRQRGVEVLSHVLTSLDSGSLSEKEIEVISEFICLRLIDHQSMEQPALRCISYFVDCQNKPARFNKNILEFLKSKTNVHKMESKTRSLVYEIVKKVIVERRQRSDTIDSDLMYSLVHMIEGENSPQNLLICFAIVSYVLKNFRELEPFIDDLFEWLSSYYPVDYTPNRNDDSDDLSILRSDLVEALYDCFYANQLNSENLQTLLLEKLETGIVSSKIESLQCLIKCYEVFPLKSVKDYASSLWTAVRMDCLKKKESLDPELLETNLAALSALARKISEDNEIYFTFISDMYEELSIAFRKPEMDLFEPAALLMASAAQPKLTGFNYILSKILPTSICAISANELRPASGLTYIFQQLSLFHPGSKLGQDLDDSLNKLVILVTENVGTNEENLKLLRAMICYKTEFKNETLDRIIGKLLSEVTGSPLDLEECLALICANYNRSDILFDDTKKNCDISSLIEMVTFYKCNEMVSDQENRTIMIKFSTYLRLLNILLDACEPTALNELDQKGLNGFLIAIRTKAIEIEQNSRIVENIARLHSTVINKLDDDLVNPILMGFYGSEYCQKLAPDEAEMKHRSSHVLMPVIQWILKSLVVRNHQTAPLINLILNFIASDKVDENLALSASRIFKFVHSDDRSCEFDRKRHYRVFVLWRQKFYAQTTKEIKIRYDTQKDDMKRCFLITSLALQIPYLPATAYKKDHEWLLRELFKILTNLKDHTRVQEGSIYEELIAVIFECVESLIRTDASGNLFGLLGSLIELCLVYAKEARTLQVRKRALVCLTNIATSFKDSELLAVRPSVVDKLKSCLADKKRVVRQAAANARLRWVLVGQPIGS